MCVLLIISLVVLFIVYVERIVSFELFVVCDGVILVLKIDFGVIFFGVVCEKRVIINIIFNTYIVV